MEICNDVQEKKNDNKDGKKEENTISKIIQSLQNTRIFSNEKGRIKFSNNVLVSKVCYKRKKKEIPTKNTTCILCDANATRLEHYTTHLKNPISPTSEWSEKQTGCLEIITNYDSHKQQFSIKIYNRNSVELRLGNIILLSNKVIMEEMGDKYKNQIFNNNLDADITFEIDRSLLSSVKRNRLLIIYEDKNGICEYLECIDFYVLGQTLHYKPNELEMSLKFNELHIYSTSLLIRTLFHRKFRSVPNQTAEEKLKRITLTTFKPNMLNPSNYVKMFTLFLEIEDYEESMDSCDLSSYIKKQNEIYSFKVTYSQFKDSTNLSSILEEGRFVTIQNPKKVTKIKYYGAIKSFNLASMSIEFSIFKKKIFDSQHCKDTLYKICISTNRMTVQLQYLAMERINEFNIPKCLFPVRPNIFRRRKIQLKLFNKHIESNLEQKKAIQHIVMGTSYPAPYIIFGPPGTGKTSVIVESVCQLVKMKPRSKILICVGANSVGDDIASALLKYIFKIRNRPKLLRLYSLSANRNVINEDVSDISNYNEGYPTLECIYQFNIIVTTLAVCGRLLQAGIYSSHFTHIFIDEAGCVLETMALLPIAACSKWNKINAEIILSGDPNQLGPITKCRINPLKLNGSFLERLMKLKMYKKDKYTNKYNANVITKLIKNYRSHGSIIKIPNELLYEGEMIAAGSEEKTKWALNLLFLPAPNFPIVFVDFCGRAEKEKNGTSWFNEREIAIVIEYIKRLFSIETKRQIKQRDIGICTPYKAHCNRLRDSCAANNWNEIEIGVAEQFQGQEKPIMLISMVRTKTKKNKTLGFLNDIKRWNVIVTRAEALLIVIGDSALLELCSYWKKFIDYVKTNNGFIIHKTRIGLKINND